PDFGLEMTTPAREATGRIVRAMLELIAANFAGIVNDLDTEFLHDYRICLRKIRSLLSLVKGVYPAVDSQQIR
ncbi:CHAD domain-containing protein, partial [bacterium]|nr:CHAD domain-containing protein [bacterium]